MLCDWEVMVKCGGSCCGSQRQRQRLDIQEPGVQTQKTMDEQTQEERE